MSAVNIIGAFLLAAPLAWFFGLTVYAMGWLEAIKLWSVTVGLVSMIVLGAFMITAK